MTPSRRTWLVALLLITPSLSTLAGCSGKAEFDTKAQYTPETLAQELVFRYKALSPEGKTAVRKKKPSKGPVGSKADELSTTKSQSKAAAKKDLAKTLDDVLDEIEEKANLIKGTPRAEIFKQVADAVSKDTSLPETDRQTITGRVNELGKS